MRRRTILWIYLPILIMASILALADDEQKAEKQLHKVTAMASDPTGRRVVSVVVADDLGAKRSDLVTERRTMNVNYGDLYIAHALTKSGVKMEDIAGELKASKEMSEIANEHHANWKAIANDAKKLNAKMEDTLYKNFMNGKPLHERDAADNYEVNIDVVIADNDVSTDELADAEKTYQVWKDRATQASGGKLDTSGEQAAYSNRGDPTRGKLPAGNGVGSGPPK
jgi:hypothetical protein